jgi:uncharacterized damage-inducible protein DinB
MKNVLSAALCAAALCSFSAVAAHAQAGMGGMSMGSTASGAGAIFEKQLAGEQGEVESLVDAMPADKFNFAPTSGEFKGVRTFAEQAKHLTEANYGFFHDFGIAGGKTRAQIEALSSKSDIEQALKASFVYAHQGLATITADNAFTPMGDGSRAATAVAYLAHIMDHYGQMVVYLRMNGIVPPASRR